MENYNYALGYAGGLMSLDSKANAIAFAIMMATHCPGLNKPPRVNLKKAQVIFDFISRNVNLPEVKVDPTCELSAQLVKTMEALNTVTAKTHSNEKEVVKN